jgi:hypothetical protein
MTDPVRSLWRTVTETEHTLIERYTWPDGYIELRWDRDPVFLDEFVLEHPRAIVHYEAMTKDHVWMAITIGDWSIDFNWGGKNLSMRAEVNV